MKTIKNYLKLIAYFFTITICLQGCAVYNKSGVSLQEASKTEEKVKIEKIDGEYVKFLKILERNDGNFYGLEKRIVNGEWSEISTLLNESDITKVQIKDKTKSTVATVLMSVSIAGVIGLALYAASWSSW